MSKRFVVGLLGCTFMTFALLTHQGYLRDFLFWCAGGFAFIGAVLTFKS